MAANFESGVTFGKKSWHGKECNLDQLHPHRFDIAAAMQAAGMGWKVNKIPLMCSIEPDMHPDLRGAGLMGAYGIYRTMANGSVELFSGVTVGEKYTPLQNSEMFSWFQPFLESRKVAVETAGSLDGGKKVWVMCTLLGDDGAPTVDLGGGEIIKRNVLLSGSHDGTCATRAGFCEERVVCANTLAMAHAEGGFLRVKHTANQMTALALVRESVDLMTQRFVATEDLYRRMMACPIDRSDLRDYVLRVFDVAKPNEMTPQLTRMIDDCVTSAISGVGQSGSVRDLTVWSAYNGVTEFLTHRRLKDGEARTKSLWYGESNSRNARAFDLATKLAS